MFFFLTEHSWRLMWQSACWFQSNSGQVNIWACILFSLHSNAQMRSARLSGEPYRMNYEKYHILWIKKVLKIIKMFTCEWKHFINLILKATGINELSIQMLRNVSKTTYFGCGNVVNFIRTRESFYFVRILIPSLI